MKRAILLASLAFLLLTGSVMAQGASSIPWSVIGGGGGHAEAAPYALDGTVGQPIVGQVSNYSLCSGYWCGAAAQVRVYLPLVLRNF
ncbi:MAG: hypothetical protein H5T61_03130 [Thermoflexales bacterium]|nr:hypothetical protein [Thermoflexales bacterium]